MNKTEGAQDDLLTQMLNLGAAMLACGADVNLVESSLERMGAAYGAVQMEVFVITSSIVVTMTCESGSMHTQTRRIHTAMSNDFRKLERLNTLCNRCCNERLAPATMGEELQSIRCAPVSRAYLYLGSVLAAGSFAVFFGGWLPEAVVAAVFAVVICLLLEHFKPYCPNEIVFNFVASLISGLGICAIAKLVGGLNADAIMIGDIMLLIPGIAITNSMRDMLSGDTIAGTLRFVESLFWAGAIACGFMLAMWAVGA